MFTALYKSTVKIIIWHNFRLIKRESIQFELTLYT